MNVEKVTVRLGGILTTGAVLSTADPGAWAGIDSETVRSGAVQQNAAVTLNTIDNTAVNRGVPLRSSTDGPVQAIAIAGDSAIAECNLHIQNQMFRVGVGCPFVGQIDDLKDLRISAARSIPILNRRHGVALESFANFNSFYRVWESPEPQEILDGVMDAAGPTLPLRLQFYRGDARPLSNVKRSGYHGEFLMNGQVAGTPSSFFFCTDGRRRVRVSLTRNGTAATFGIWGVQSFKNANLVEAGAASADPRVDIASFDELVPAGTAIDQASVCTVFDWTGNPYFAFLVEVPNTNAGLRASISFSAWDD